MSPTRARSIEDLQRALIQVVRRSSVPRAHDRIATRAAVEVDRVEAVALSRIVDNGSMGLTELAAQLGVACSTAGRHAAHLEERALCTRTVDPVDSRAVVVTPTDLGRSLVASLRATYREVLGEILEQWSDGDLAHLSDLLGRFGEDLSALSEPALAPAP
ncbi:MAG: MarR family transcriptional regulator [Acidimicrobiia bacterium]